MKQFTDCVVFKEIPDWAGCDLVVLKSRYQIKLGAESIYPGEAEVIIKKLKKGRKIKK
jgi:hypothetical protein